MKEIFENIKTIAEEVFFPDSSKCCYCFREIYGGYFCGRCFKKLKFNDGATCPVCGRKTARDEICIECKAHRPSFERAASPLVYDGFVIAIIKRFKDKGPYIGKFFAEEINKILPKFPAFDGIVYVPMSKKAERRRGFNQSKIIADYLSPLAGTPVIEGALEKVKNTAPQKTLSREERAKNLEGCFKAERKLVKDKVLLVIDDVTTTGATLDCVCSVLKKAGAKAVYAATAASVEYKSDIPVPPAESQNETGGYE